MDMQNSETVPNSESTKFYKDGAEYWEGIPATVDGMLGGLGHVSQMDIDESEAFLKKVLYSDNDSVSPGRERACDCGAGIGRITKLLLSRHFKTVDLVDQNQAFLDQAPEFLGPQAKKLGKLICSGLQELCPPKNTYDVIWIQWVLGHLTDSHLVKFLEDCKHSLRGNGVIFIKENVTSSGEVEEDEEDSSVTRTPNLLRKIFRRAGLRILTEGKQKKFPTGLYPVKMYALVPSS